MDLSSLIETIKGNVLVKDIATLQNTANEKKPRKIAEIIVKHMHASLSSPTPKEILHNGEIHKITYFDITPLLRGTWSITSLLLLHLSYGEQVIIIEAIYPKDIQLTAKAFAINFTPNVKTTNVTIQNDKEVIDKVDIANTGIAMIITMLQQFGYKVGHRDEIVGNKMTLKQITEQVNATEHYKNASNLTNQINQFRDHLKY